MVGGVQELVGVGGRTSRGSVHGGGGVVPRAGRGEHGVEGILAFLAVWTCPGSEVDGGGGPEFEHVAVDVVADGVMDVVDEAVATARTGAGDESEEGMVVGWWWSWRETAVGVNLRLLFTVSTC